MFKFHPNTLQKNLFHLAENGRWEVLLWLVLYGLTGLTDRLSQQDVIKERQQKLDPNLDFSEMTLEEFLWMVVDVPGSKAVWSKYLAHLPNESAREEARLKYKSSFLTIQAHWREEKKMLEQKRIEMMQGNDDLKRLHETVTQLFADGVNLQFI